MVSVIIPSVGEPTLERTIADIKKNFRGDYEIIVVSNKGLRTAVNEGVSKAKGEYILKTDEHCKFSEDFDVKLLTGIQDNWIVVPRRYKLNIDTWEVYPEQPNDYDRLTIRDDKIGGVRWPNRDLLRRDLMIDETMVFQGSCYLMKKDWFNKIGGLQTEGYGEFAQEAIELAMKTWTSGGKVMVNKHAWYAHKHRDFKRFKNPSNTREGNRYSKELWLKDAERLIKKFK